jgi:glycosyltransferase involved in cell wall biosynthesis
MIHSLRHIAFVATVPGTVRAFMIPHLLELAKKYEITIYSNFMTDSADDLRFVFKDLPVHFVHVGFERKIRPLIDLKSICELFWHLRRDRPAVLHSMMPKTGLIATTAGLIARTPIRIHMFTGQVWASQKGWMRLFLKAMDLLTAWSASHILADSPSQKDFLIKNSFPSNITVLGSGSVSGVDLKRFKPDREVRKRVRIAYGIAENALVFGFLGRMNRDKGVADLLSAFQCADLAEYCHLMLVGPDEENIGQTLNQLETSLKARVHMCGYTDRPEDYLAAFDIYCLPSYREGFGTSVIEAAACGVPALVSKIYGLTDAVVNKETGLFHPAGDIPAIASGLLQFATDTQLRKKLGRRAQRRVAKQYDENFLISEMANFYQNLPIK